MHGAGRRGRQWPALLFALLWLGGCAQKPALQLSGAVLPPPLTPARVEMLIAGSDALAARLDLIERARQRIVFQYYLFHADSSGELFAAALLRAADRGVQVRGLIDDISGADRRLMKALAAHPNIQIRRYNPFRLQELRLLEMLLNFREVGRRMHNKQLTVDGRWSIVGGRNIGDEYFGSSQDIAFADLDVLVEGPAAAEVEKSFEEYWSAPRSKARGRDDPDRLRELREKLVQSADPGKAAMLRRVEQSGYRRLQAAGMLLRQSCPTLVLADHPGKPDGAPPESRVVRQLAQSLREAKEDVFLVSAYFVPGTTGTELLAAAVMRQVRVEVVTNSLASLDVPAVHAGYARYREPLLRAGVVLRETRPVLRRKESAETPFGSSRASLHTKAYFFDRRLLFVGSFNLDPRSAVLNTEMGLLFDCPAVARPMREALGSALPVLAYRVYLDEQGALRWEGRHGGETEVLDREPGAGFWRRFQVWGLGWLPIESEL